MGKKKILTIAFQLIIIAVIGFGAIWATSFLVDDEKPNKEEIAEEVVEKIIVKRPECSDTFDSYNNLKKVTLVQGHNSYGNGIDFVNKKILNVKSSGSGSKIACGYLYFEGRVGDRPLQQEWENLYIKPSQFGGHIVSDNAIINREVNNKTQLLFNLKNIEYRLTKDSLGTRTADWSSLLNVSNLIEFEIALNTLFPDGVIETVNLAYQCWSPETGKITDDCELVVQD